MELIQALFTTHRNGDVLDALMNGIGVLIAVVLFKYLGIYRRIMLRIVVQRKFSKSC
jgi:glycopeptide antibiotics resistance protein